MKLLSAVLMMVGMAVGQNTMPCNNQNTGMMRPLFKHNGQYSTSRNPEYCNGKEWVTISSIDVLPPEYSQGQTFTMPQELAGEDMPWPLLVPAVDEKVITHSKGEGYTCGQDWCIASEDQYGKHDTCADKSRILLRSEDGKGWCMATPRADKDSPK